MGNNKITHESCKEKSVIFYELNENPEKLINYFIDKYQNQIFQKSSKDHFFKLLLTRLLSSSLVSFAFST